MDNNIEKDFNFRKFWGSESKRYHVEYRRDRDTFCIYCGSKASSREHSPSKVFLNLPYPDNLPTLPACRKCNNSYSDDELYSEVFLDSLKCFSGYEDNISEENQSRIYKNMAFYDAQKFYYNYVQDISVSVPEQLVGILKKLSFCHVVYELCEGYNYGDQNTIEIIEFVCRFRFQMKNEQIEEFKMPINIDESVIPELGSRIYENIRIIEPLLKPIGGGADLKMNLVLLFWTVIQENNYEYIVWIDKDFINVKIAIHDFTFVYVKYKRVIQ